MTRLLSQPAMRAVERGLIQSAEGEVRQSAAIDAAADPPLRTVVPYADPTTGDRRYHGRGAVGPPYRVRLPARPHMLERTFGRLVTVALGGHLLS